MKTARALSKYVHMSPKKMQDMVRIIRGRNTAGALQMLKLIPRKSARLVAKTLKSAIANASVKGGVEEEFLVKEATAEQGVAFKRFIPAARGSAHPVRKRTSHIKIILISKQYGTKG